MIITAISDKWHLSAGSSINQVAWHLPSSFCGTDEPLAAAAVAGLPPAPPPPPASCCAGNGDAVVPLVPIAGDVGVGTRCNEPCPPPRLVLPRGRPRFVPRGWWRRRTDEMPPKSPRKSARIRIMGFYWLIGVQFFCGFLYLSGFAAGTSVAVKQTELVINKKNLRWEKTQYILL